jgi:hypothetical protein
MEELCISGAVTALFIVSPNCYFRFGKLSYFLTSISGRFVVLSEVCQPQILVADLHIDTAGPAVTILEHVFASDCRNMTHPRLSLLSDVEVVQAQVRFFLMVV